MKVGQPLKCKENLFEEEVEIPHIWGVGDDVFGAPSSSEEDKKKTTKDGGSLGHEKAVEGGKRQASPLELVQLKLPSLLVRRQMSLDYLRDTLVAGS